MELDEQPINLKNSQPNNQSAFEVASYKPVWWRESKKFEVLTTEVQGLRVR